MSSITVRLPDSLHRKIREVAKKDGVSINQFISSAAGEKLSAILTVDYIKARAKRGKHADFDKVLSKVPDREPLEWDKIE
ncbi:MAG: toxin-antitoxin system HicB family antitoxin [Candidatus Brocadiales bacterium]|nr:toxin-antitoxin system HicB family antitoxin [Candidatus Brocadiales bacterium]